MALDETRAMLDELMGKDRDKLPDEKARKSLKFSDYDVCKYYICGFCPHDLFVNTKSDLGECTKVHDEDLKKEWQDYPHKDKYPYQSDFIRFLERLVGDLDKKMKRHGKRLEMQDMPDNSLGDQNKLRLANINAEIEVLVRKIEDLADEGEIEQANDCMKKLDALKNEKQTLTRSSEMRTITSQEKKMRVCEICGAFLVVNDTDKRTASHLEGKQHQGYALIRQTLEDYYKQKEQERKQRRDREKDRDRGKDRERDRGGRDRERDRERDSERDRLREREKHRGRRTPERENKRKRSRSPPKDNRYDEEREQKKRR